MFIFLPAPPSEADELKPFLRGSYASILQAHAKRPLVVSFWATTCAPCVAELKEWNAWRKTHAGFDLVLVSTDRPGMEPRARNMLKDIGLDGVESWIFADSFAERLRFEVDPRWRGELPRSYLIAADGAIKAVTGLVAEEDFRAWLAGQG